MSHIKPMDMNGADLSSAQHLECSADFDAMAREALAEQYVGHEQGQQHGR